MNRYGKACARCGSYYVGDNMVDNLCPWCKEIVSGIKQSDLYSRPEDVETLEV